MRRLVFQAASLFILGLSITAHASPIAAGTYDLTNVTVTDLSSNTYSLSGSLVVNASGLVTSASITLNDSVLGSPVFNVVSTSSGPGGYAPVADYAQITGSAGQLNLYYLTTLDGSGNIDVCILSQDNCNSYQASYMHLDGASSFGYNNVDLNGGTLTNPPPAVPEPQSLALLATGILGCAGIVRRRFGKA